MVNKYRLDADRVWHRARRKAFWAKLFSSLGSGHEDRIRSFDEIGRRLRLTNTIYRGVQSIPLDKIIGSVGRYQDFARAFLPTRQIDAERWKQVAAAYLNPNSGGVPPIEVFKVGGSYFVKDGNHRVSVVRQLGNPDIEAYVWEYNVPLADVGDTGIDDLLLKAERQEFLSRSRLDELRPQHHIAFTLPGGYLDLLAQIAGYQDVLSRIDEADISYEDAVTAWYDMVYETTVQIIAREGLLDMFPDRTSGDFFVWVTRHHRELKAHYGSGSARLTQSIRAFRRKQRVGIRAILRRVFERLWLDRSRS
ncbi:MAG: hypothetical protein GYB66_10395 [Chloroflexi bacterium]|nr:hypothetical protein [Chloroflexota bacterium]